MQAAPICQRLFPQRAADKTTAWAVKTRRQRPALQVGDGFLVHRHQTGARAALDGHVADCHAALDRQRPNRTAGKFNRVAGAAGGADVADDGQHHVLGAATGRQLAVDPHQHVFGFFGQQGLRRHDVLDLAGANAVRQRAKCAVGRGVAIAADHRHARQGGAVFRPDHVHDALTPGHEREIRGRAKFGDIAIERANLLFADRVGDAVVAQLPAGGRRIVVGRGHHRTDAPELAAGLTQTLKGLRTGDFVHQVAVDVEHGGAVVLGVDDVFVPYLVVERASHENPLAPG